MTYEILFMDVCVVAAAGGAALLLRLHGLPGYTRITSQAQLAERCGERSWAEHGLLPLWQLRQAACKPHFVVCAPVVGTVSAQTRTLLSCFHFATNITYDKITRSSSTNIHTHEAMHMHWRLLKIATTPRAVTSPVLPGGTSRLNE
jgi:hypothetical protein